MLDSAILNQLRDAFALLESPIQLVLTNSSHPKSSELRAMADALATTSSLIEVRLSEDESVATVRCSWRCGQAETRFAAVFGSENAAAAAGRLHRRTRCS